MLIWIVLSIKLKGPQPYVITLHQAVLGFIKTGFRDMDLESVAADCQKDDNSKYTDDDISGLQSDLAEHRKTLNLPFCFTPGALQIKRAFIEKYNDLGHDVEVGVYLSRVGGDQGAH